MTIAREGHAIEGRALAVISRLKRRGVPSLLVELPDGSRTYIPVAWTTLEGAGGDRIASPANYSSIGRFSDFFHLRLLTDALLERRGESLPDDKEKRYADEAEIAEEDSKQPPDPPAWEKLDAAARTKALCRLAIMIARMLAAMEVERD